jgi:hypothetical protein
MNRTNTIILAIFTAPSQEAAVIVVGVARPVTAGRSHGTSVNPNGNGLVAFLVHLSRSTNCGSSDCHGHRRGR